MARQAERSATTRGAILGAARRLFGAEGFAAIGVDRIATEAGVAKGAVYHHFATKEAIFEAVLDAVSADLAVDVRAAARNAHDVLASLVVATQAYVAGCARPEVGRIVLADGPAVLGWPRWRQIDDAHFGAGLTAALTRAMTDGLIARQPIAPLARVLQGALTETAMACAEGADPAAHIAALQSLIDGLRR